MYMNKNLMIMKRIILLVCCFYFVIQAIGQHRTEVVVTDLDNESLVSNVQVTLSNLISELNQAQMEKRNPILKGLKLDESVKNSIAALWETSPFRCMESEIVESALLTYSQEYEIRNIPFIFSAMDKDDQYHEAAVTFNSQGVVTSFHMVIAQNLYYQVMKSKHGVTDLRRRQMILDYVEQFRTAYNTKDIEFLNQVFSDDALIITGKIIKVKPTKENNFISSKTVFNKQDKKTYLARLSELFRKNSWIKIAFDEIKVMRHPNPNLKDWYGVTLHQNYKSSIYSDEGWLFLLWDFSNEDEPTIHVRSWQPDKNTITGRMITEDEVFGFDDVNIR